MGCSYTLNILKKLIERNNEHVNNAKYLLYSAPFEISALNCFFVNARELLSKIDVLQDCTLTKNFDVIGVAEAFLNG
jgi:hypothetical protein